MLKAVANRNRLVILCELLKGERSVSALQGAIGLSQSALSQHLARLREDELVATRRESQTIYYSLSSKPVTRLIGLLYELYCAPHCDRGGVAPQDKEKSKMTLDRAVMAFAGCVVLLSLALAYLFSPYWLLLTTFAGLNLIQASFTGFCPAAIVFKRLGVGPGTAFK